MRSPTSSTSPQAPSKPTSPASCESSAPETASRSPCGPTRPAASDAAKAPDLDDGGAYVVLPLRRWLCDRCDLLVGPDGLRVVGVDRDDGGALTLMVESEPSVMGCRACGVVARSHGRLEIGLVDAPAMDRAVRICCRRRRWICPEPACPVTTF